MDMCNTPSGGVRLLSCAIAFVPRPWLYCGNIPSLTCLLELSCCITHAENYNSLKQSRSRKFVSSCNDCEWFLEEQRRDKIVLWPQVIFGRVIECHCIISQWTDSNCHCLTFLLSFNTPFFLKTTPFFFFSFLVLLLSAGPQGNVQNNGT